MPLTHAQSVTGPITYERRRPENTLLYRLVERYYPEFEALMAAQETPLPDYVRQEFDAYLKCGRLEHASRAPPGPEYSHWRLFE